MRLASTISALAIAVALGGCGTGIADINARPNKYYEHKVTFVGQIARTQRLESCTLLEIADARDRRILVRSNEPVDAGIGDWVKVTGVLVAEAKIDGTTLYDVVAAERIAPTRRPRLENLM
jgi:hypothetical protein